MALTQELKSHGHEIEEKIYSGVQMVAKSVREITKKLNYVKLRQDHSHAENEKLETIVRNLTEEVQFSSNKEGGKNPILCGVKEDTENNLSLIEALREVFEESGVEYEENCLLESYWIDNKESGNEAGPILLELSSVTQAPFLKGARSYSKRE